MEGALKARRGGGAWEKAWRWTEDSETDAEEIDKAQKPIGATNPVQKMVD